MRIPSLEIYLNIPQDEEEERMILPDLNSPTDIIDQHSFYLNSSMSETHEGYHFSLDLNSDPYVETFLEDGFNTSMTVLTLIYTICPWISELQIFVKY